MISKCAVCSRPIKNRRPDSIYCSTSCAGRAKRQRALDKRGSNLNGFTPDYEKKAPKTATVEKTVLNELRTVEKDNFNTILQLRGDYDERIRLLENENLRKDFTIDKLKDKISDLGEKHSKDVTEANTSTTKETVQAIAQMPAIQTMLGSLASSIIPSPSGNLNGLDDYSIQEKQIIDSIRKMQPDAQAHLCQMLYFLFAKTNDEQLEIFNALHAYMSQPVESEDI